jgi:hypothetical protein
MPTYHEAQLPDGRCIRLRELTSQEHARAYDAAAVHRPDGGLAPPNPLTLARELHMAALVAVTDPKPLFKLGPDGKPLPRLVARHRAMLVHLRRTPTHLDDAALVHLDDQPTRARDSRQKR